MQNEALICNKEELLSISNWLDTGNITYLWPVPGSITDKSTEYASNYYFIEENYRHTKDKRYLFHFHMDINGWYFKNLSNPINLISGNRRIQLTCTWEQAAWLILSGGYRIMSFNQR